MLWFIFYHSDSQLSEEHRSKALCLLLHTADISHPGKPWDVHSVWTSRITEEFFRQGDWEKELALSPSPLCDRNTTLLSQSSIGILWPTSYSSLSCLVDCSMNCLNTVCLLSWDPIHSILSTHLQDSLTILWALYLMCVGTCWSCWPRQTQMVLPLTEYWNIRGHGWTILCRTRRNGRQSTQRKVIPCLWYVMGRWKLLSCTATKSNTVSNTRILYNTCMKSCDLYSSS